MSAPKKKPSLLVAILISAALSLAVNGVRLVGELQGWAPEVFNREGGGGGSPLGITWLVLPFGFWFGRVLAKNGSRPRSNALALLLPLVAAAAVAGLFVLAFATLWKEPRTGEDWVTLTCTVQLAGAVAGLATLIAWPRAWVALVFYGILARLPVIAIQYYSIVKGWDVHFAKGPPGMPDDVVLFALTLAQSTIWPLGWTPIAGGLAAAIGALTVKRGGKPG
ncbi:MAG: hypothetical protein KDE27_18980 [Planctomycetes bacterium]|nr:hypothetical protein [Planctomycetota bacterium]